MLENLYLSWPGLMRVYTYILGTSDWVGGGFDVDGLLFVPIYYHITNERYIWSQIIFGKYICIDSYLVSCTKDCLFSIKVILLFAHQP